jgi:hypothetical protein
MSGTVHKRGIKTADDNGTGLSHSLALRPINFRSLTLTVGRITG